MSRRGGMPNTNTHIHSHSRRSSKFTIYHWILHFADISTPTLEWDEFLQHSQHCLKEFINEAALNVKHNLTPPPHNLAIIPWYNLLKPGKPVTYKRVQPIFHSSQDGFIRYLVKPHLEHIYWFRVKEDKAADKKEDKVADADKSGGKELNYRINSLYAKLSGKLDKTLSNLQENTDDNTYKNCVQELVTYINDKITQLNRGGGKRSRTLQRRTRRSVKAWGGMDNDPSKNMTGRLQVANMTNRIFKTISVGNSMSWKHALCSYNPNTHIFKYTPESMGIPETPIEVLVTKVEPCKNDWTEDIDTHRKFNIECKTLQVSINNGQYKGNKGKVVNFNFVDEGKMPSDCPHKVFDVQIVSGSLIRENQFVKCQGKELKHHTLRIKFQAKNEDEAKKWVKYIQRSLPFQMDPAFIEQQDTFLQDFYYDNPYHNQDHGRYVAQKSSEFYTHLFRGLPNESTKIKWELYVAGMFHDCKHPGVTTYEAAKTFAEDPDIGRLSEYLEKMSLKDSNIQAAGTKLALEDVHAAIFEKAMGKTFAQYGLDVQFIAELIQYTQMNLWKEESTRRETMDRETMDRALLKEHIQDLDDPLFTKYIRSILSYIYRLLKPDKKVLPGVSEAEYQFSVQNGIPLCITQYLTDRNKYSPLREEMNKVIDAMNVDPHLYDLYDVDPHLYENILGQFVSIFGNWTHTKNTLCMINYEGTYPKGLWKITNEQGNPMLYHENSNSEIPPSTGWKYIESKKGCPVKIDIIEKKRLIIRDMFYAFKVSIFQNEPILKELINLLRKQASLQQSLSHVTRKNEDLNTELLTAKKKALKAPTVISGTDRKNPRNLMEVQRGLTAPTGDYPAVDEQSIVHNPRAIAM